MDENITLNLTGYIKTIADLECSIFRQEKVIEAAKEELKIAEQHNSQMCMPPKETVTLPVEPKKPIDNRQDKISTIKKTYFFQRLLGYALITIAAIILCGFLFQRYILGFTYFSLTGIIVTSILCAVIGIGLLYYYGQKIKGQSERVLYSYKEDVERYERTMALFPEKLKEAEEHIQQIEREYEVARQKFFEKKSNVEANYHIAEEGINSLETSLNELKITLERLYSQDIVFVKYRYMVAMTTIYEYLAAKRCDKLEGPDGAYNLFEAELRQDLIINKLDKISSQLEDIKNNQYTLYTEMVKTNQEIKTTSGLLQNVLQTTNVIAQTSLLNSHLLALNAANTAQIAAASEYFVYTSIFG